MYSGLSDEQLIGLYLQGDQDCYGVLYCRYYAKVYSRCYSFAKNKDDAFDMTQEILLKVLSHLESFGGHSKFSTWLYSISTNYCITYVTRKRRRNHEDILAAQYIQENGMGEEDYNERARWEALLSCLDDFLGMLPEEERQLLVLKYRRNYSVKDLQKEFDLSASAIKMRLLRARTKMSQIISLEEAA